MEHAIITAVIESVSLLDTLALNIRCSQLYSHSVWKLAREREREERERERERERETNRHTYTQRERKRTRVRKWKYNTWKACVNYGIIETNYVIFVMLTVTREICLRYMI